MFSKALQFFRKINIVEFNAYNILQQDISTFSLVLCQNTPIESQPTGMEESSQMAASRKRHLTPLSGDPRIVAQKMEGDFYRGTTEVPNAEAQDQKSCDFCLTDLFSEDHLKKQINCDQSIDLPECEIVVLHSSRHMDSSPVDDSPVNDAVGQDIDVEDDTSNDDQTAPDNVIGQVKVSHAVFAALKAGDDIFGSKLAETGCTIQLPKKMKKPVTVVGSSEEDVRLACELLKAGVTGAKRARPQLTHFVSLRLTDEPLRRRFDEFRTLVRALQPDQDLLPDRLFQRPEKLHISISMLRLPDEAALQSARDVLDACCRQLRDQPPAHFRLRGLGTFGSAGRSRVLFSRPEPADRLQTAAELVHGRLSEAGLTARQQGDITLHATLLNTTFLTRGAAGRRWRKFRGFDHSAIVEQLGEFDFGEVRPVALEISSLTEKAADGYYASVGCGLLGDPAVPRPESSLWRGAGAGESRTDADRLQCADDGESSSDMMVEVVPEPLSPPKDVELKIEATLADSKTAPRTPPEPLPHSSASAAPTTDGADTKDF